MTASTAMYVASVAVLAVGLVAIVRRELKVSSTRALVGALFAMSQIAIVCTVSILMVLASAPEWMVAVVLAVSCLCVVADILLMKGFEGTEWRLYSDAEVRLLEEQVETLRAYDEHLSRERETSRRALASLADKLVEVQRALEESQTDAALAHAEQAGAMLVRGPRRFCPHRVIDALLTGKSRTCAERGVRFSARIDLPSERFLPTPVLVAVFANAIDNAIAACADVDADKRFVDVRARIEAGFFLLEVDNSCAKTARLAERRDAWRERFFSNPALAGGVPEHGWGMGILRDLSKRYGGSVQAAADDGRCKVVVAMEAMKPSQGASRSGRPGEAQLVV